VKENPRYQREITKPCVFGLVNTYSQNTFMIHENYQQG